MKLETIFIMVLVVALIFAAVGGIVNDFRTYYPEAGNVSTEWESAYNYEKQLTGNFTNIQSDIENIVQAETGWQIFFGGFMVMAKSVFSAILMVLTSPIYAIAIISGLAKNLGAPDIVSLTIIPIFITMIIGIVIFALIKFLHKTPQA